MGGIVKLLYRPQVREDVCVLYIFLMLPVLLVMPAWAKLGKYLPFALR